METIIKLLTSDGGAFAVVALLLLLAGWTINKVSTITANHSSLSKSLDSSSKYIDEIRADLSYLKGALAQFLSAPVSKERLLDTHSPIALTEAGVKLATQMGAEQIIASNFDRIAENIEGKNLKNAYDIQQYAMQTAAVEPEKFFSPADVDSIKNVAFKKGLGLFSIGNVLGVMIRDAYLKRKGIDISEVDKCDPAKQSL